MANQETLDEIDIKILKLLQQNSHMTVKELAARVHLSTSPTFERQKRLEREGYIKRYSAVVDHHKMGHSVIVLCNIRLKQHTHELIQQFMDTVQTTYTINISKSVEHEVLIVLHVMGINFYQEVVVARGIIALGYLIDGLHSIIVIGEIKDSHYIPVSRCY